LGISEGDKHHRIPVLLLKSGMTPSVLPLLNELAGFDAVAARGSFFGFRPIAGVRDELRVLATGDETSAYPGRLA